MKSSVSEWLDGDAWADIEQMRQPKPMPPAKKKNTVTRYADMTPEKAEHKRKLKKKWRTTKKCSTIGCDTENSIVRKAGTHAANGRRNSRPNMAYAIRLGAGGSKRLKDASA